MWEDEFATLKQVHEGFWGMIAGTAMDTYPPGYNILAWISVRLFGETEIGLRLPATLLSIATIPATYWLGRVVAGRVVGLTSAALLTLSPFAIAYAQEARPYALLMLTATLYLAALWAMVTAPSRQSWWLATVAGVLLLYSHPYATLLFAAVALTMLVALRLTGAPREVRRSVLRSSLAAGAFFLPWALILAAVALRLSVNGFWIPRPTLSSILDAVMLVIGGDVLSLAMLATLIAGGVIGFSARRQSSVAAHLPALVALATAALAPLVVGVTISLVGTPVFTARYLAGSLPAFLVLVAVAANALATTKWLRYVVPLALVALAVVNWRLQPVSPSSQDWRSAAAFVAVNAGPACVVVRLGPEKMALDYYLPTAPACEFVFNPAAIEAKANTADAIVLVSIAKRSADPLATMRKILPEPAWSSQTNRFEGVAVTTFSRGGR